MLKLRKPLITVAVALSAAFPLAGCASNATTTVTPPVEEVVEEVVVEPEPTVPAETPGTPTPDGSLAASELEAFRTDFMEGCQSEGGTEPYCTCAFDYIGGQLTSSDLEALADGSATTEQEDMFVDLLMSAAGNCLSELNLGAAEGTEFGDGTLPEDLGGLTWESMKADYLAGCVQEGTSEEYCNCSFDELSNTPGLTLADAAAVVLGTATEDQQDRFVNALLASAGACWRYLE